MPGGAAPAGWVPVPPRPNRGQLRARQRAAVPPPAHAGLSPALTAGRTARGSFYIASSGLGKTSTAYVSVHGDRECFLNKLDCRSNSFYLLARVK